MYDRREKKRIQKKWAKFVEHIAKEPLDTTVLPRKVSVFIAAPPGDTLLPARDHFNEYVKPVLVAAALDWDAVEGRREGDVRAGLAERIRKLRKRMGEESVEPIEEDLEIVLAHQRARAGVKPSNGPAGDIIIGRHTWKEYVRGLHEGWLGPLDPPSQPPRANEDTGSSNEQAAAPTPVQPLSLEFASEANSTPLDDASPTVPINATKPPEPEKAVEGEEAKRAIEETKAKEASKKKQPPPFNTTADYATAVLSRNCPPELPPSTAVSMPHLLGFLNFPIRMYRFLNRRHVADETGRQTAAAAMAIYRPYYSPGEAHFSSDPASSTSSEDQDQDSGKWEQQWLLQQEETEWHKSVRERKDDNGKESVWIDDMVLDPRIAERMRKFELDMEQEERARKMDAQKEDPWWTTVWPGGKKEQKKGNQWGDDVD